MEEFIKLSTKQRTYIAQTNQGIITITATQPIAVFDTTMTPLTVNDTDSTNYSITDYYKTKHLLMFKPHNEFIQEDYLNQI